METRNLDQHHAGKVYPSRPSPWLEMSKEVFQQGKPCGRLDASLEIMGVVKVLDKLSVASERKSET